MINFELELIDFLPSDSEELFFKLVIEGDCPFDNFWKTMESAGNQHKNLEKIQSIIALLAQKNRVPTSWFQELKHREKNDPYPDFEIRAKQVRLYLFEDEEEGKIIVLGELKKGTKTQSKAIRKMRGLKLAYFDSKS